MTARVDDLAARLRAGDRRALARAITLVESTNPAHRRDAEALLETLLPLTGKALRVGISGPPGVGKSTFIETSGQHLIGQGRRLAVLAVDPTSRLSGGSILGDKTRMAELAKRPEAFIRPSPAGLELGGVARRTREAMLLCEAAGFDLVLVETVGVGQSETAVAEMTDMFLLLLQPAGGDDLQGIKRGIMELADLVVVNKADGDLAAAAARTASDYAHALRLMQPLHQAWTPAALQCSALTGAGIPEIWARVAEFRQLLTQSGEIDRRRQEQARAWLWHELSDALLDALREDPAVAGKLDELERRVIAGKTTPGAAARTLLERFLRP
jgi:LAO/AO transport system kinase